MSAQRSIEAFLRGSGAALGVVGQPGSGKLYATELAARATGFQVTILDRSQGPVQYNRLGASTLGENGLAKSVFAVCGADAETAWPDPKTLPKGTKLVFIGNSCRTEMKKAGLEIVQVNRPSPGDMTRTLFLDYDWDVTVAQRLARLSGGDWRQLRSLEAYFANVDVAGLSDEEFQRLLLDMAADRNPLLDAPPSAAVHQLFSGHAAKSGALEHYADHSVLMWTEANKDLVCSNLSEMAQIQEAALFADVLMNGGESQLGLETFVGAAACAANPNMRYDFAKYRNPWTGCKETPTVVAIREGWERQASWTRRERGRIALRQQEDDVPPTTQRGKRAAPKGTAKKAAKRRAAPPKHAATLPLAEVK